MRVNHEIRVPQVRVIGPEGDQLGVLNVRDAIRLAEEKGYDLVEVSAQAKPPVCKIMDFGKFRYDQAKRDKESKKAHLEVKVKEVKFKPNIDANDFETKLKAARAFLQKGCKVKVTCMFRGREMAHTELGHAIVEKLCEGVKDLATAESVPKMMGKTILVVLAPHSKKGRAAGTSADSSDANARESE